MAFFTADEYYTGPSLTPSMVRNAEHATGFRLPAAYIALLSERNGGVPVRCCWPTPFASSWAPDHIRVRALLGVGGTWGIDTPYGSKYLIREWGYPDIGIVICDTPSGGHDTVMLDYSACGSQGEPTVAYVDEDRVARTLAPSFDEFMSRLLDCAAFELPDEP